MWWKCEVRFFQTILRLKVWARSEPEARGKIQRMYQISAIEHLAPAEPKAFLPGKAPLPNSSVSGTPVTESRRSAHAMDSFTTTEAADSGQREYTSCLPKLTRNTPAWLLPKP